MSRCIHHACTGGRATVEAAIRVGNRVHDDMPAFCAACIHNAQAEVTARELREHEGDWDAAALAVLVEEASGTWEAHQRVEAMARLDRLLRQQPDPVVDRCRGRAVQRGARAMTGLSAEQLAMRRTGIGASEIAAVCGVSPFASPIDVWRRKVGLADEEEANQAMIAGIMLEPAICDWYAQEMGGVKLLSCPTMRHPEHEWAIATPDRVYADDARYLVQCKNVGLRMADHWGEDPQAIPEDYRLQIEWEMLVAGADRCDVVVLIGGQTLRIYPITRDRELGESLLRIAGAFWRNHVIANVEPPVDGSESTRRWLEKKHPRIATEIKHEPLAEDPARAYAEAVQEEKRAHAKKMLAGNALRQMIGDADGVTGAWGKATWRPNEKAAPAWKQIAEHLGATQEIIDMYTPQPPRVLRVYPKKEK